MTKDELALYNIRVLLPMLPLALSLVSRLAATVLGI